ncbi:hypothetical protein COOONC_06592 [Cooperia oncophora]
MRSHSSPTVLLDESMIPLVGTPHPMAYIPMDEVFTFVDRRPNQELPAITEEIEVLNVPICYFLIKPFDVDDTREVHLLRAVRETPRLESSLKELKPVPEPTRTQSEALIVDELKYDVEVPTGIFHRRAVSDNMGVPSDRRMELHRTQEIEEIDRACDDVEVQMRSQRPVVRASSVVSNRCQSQVSFLSALKVSATDKELH